MGRYKGGGDGRGSAGVRGRYSGRLVGRGRDRDVQLVMFGAREWWGGTVGDRRVAGAMVEARE